MQKWCGCRRGVQFVVMALALAMPVVSAKPVRAVGECGVCLRESGVRVEAGRPFEAVILAEVADLNIYDGAQIEVRVHLTAPSGWQMVVPAFGVPDSAAPFRVRIALNEHGVWRVVPQIRRWNGVWWDGPTAMWTVEMPGDAAGGVQRHGFVRVDGRNRAMLRFDDGTPYFPIGANIGWYTDDALQEYGRRFDALAAAGGTATRIWLAPWSFLPEWKDTPLRNYAAREQRMEWFDAVLRMAEARGIYVIVVLSEAGMFDPATRWTDNPYNQVNGGPCAAPSDFLTSADARASYRNQLRYIAARWGYSPNILAWEWMNEVNSAPGFETERLMPWLREMSAVLDEYDVHRHLRTISYAAIAGDPRVWAMPEIDLVQRHEYTQGDPPWFRPLPAGQSRFKQVVQQPVKPLLVGEFGANSDMENAHGAYRQGIHLHNALWAAPFAGMAGAAMYWWWDNYIEPGGLWWRHAGLAEYLRTEDLSVMTPARMGVHVGSGPDVVALRLQASADAACSRALVWVRNSAWQHDAALLRWILDKSAGKAQADTFRYAAPASLAVDIELPEMRPGRYLVTVVDTDTGRNVRTFEVISDGVVRWREGRIATDLAYKVECFVQ